MKERTDVKELVMFILLSVMVSIITVVILTPIFANYRAKKSKEELSKEFARIDRQFAIKDLSELKGRIYEIYLLYLQGEIAKELAIQEMEDCVSLSDRYVENFFLQLPETDDLGKICDELITQIEEKIHSIEHYGVGE